MGADIRELVEAVRRLRTQRTHPRYSLEGWELPEAVGAELASRLAPSRPQAVVVWAGAATAVLGHVVARELAATLVYAFADEGILGMTSELENGSRVVVVGYDWTEYPGLRAMTALLESKAVHLVGVGSVLRIADGVGSIVPTVLEGAEE
jgi:hypothetical protein